MLTYVLLYMHLFLTRERWHSRNQFMLCVVVELHEKLSSDAFIQLRLRFRYFHRVSHVPKMEPLGGLFLEVREGTWYILTSHVIGEIRWDYDEFQNCHTKFGNVMQNGVLRLCLMSGEDIMLGPNECVRWKFLVRNMNPFGVCHLGAFPFKNWINNE